MAINHWLSSSPQGEGNRLKNSLILQPYENDFSHVILTLIQKAYFLSDFTTHIPSLIIDISSFDKRFNTLIIDINGRVWKTPLAHPLFIENYTSDSNNKYKYSLWNKFLQHKLSDKISKYPYIEPDTILIPIDQSSISPALWINLKQCYYFSTYRSFHHHSECDYLGRFSFGPELKVEITLIYPLFKTLANQIVLSHKLSLDRLFHDIDPLKNSFFTKNQLVTILKKHQKYSIFADYYEVDYHCADPSIIFTFNDFILLKKIIQIIPCKDLAKYLVDSLIEVNLEAAIIYDNLFFSSTSPKDTYLS